MISQYGYTATGQHYYCLLRSLLKTGDVINAIEAIIEMNYKELPFSSNYEVNEMSFRAIKELFVNCFMTKDKSSPSKLDLDQIYYALVDQVTQSQKPPPGILLEALIEAAAKLSLKDRAFATFQELEKVRKRLILLNMVLSHLLSPPSLFLSFSPSLLLSFSPSLFLSFSPHFPVVLCSFCCEGISD
jgi:hypothetical protein